MYRMTREQQKEFDAGYRAFHESRCPPDPDMLPQAYRGYLEAEREQELRELREEREAGLDYESLDKLSKQLKALGFTIPNEEN